MTAAAILRLERSGFTAEQVEALADYLDDQLATKADLERVEMTLKADLELVKSDIERAKSDLKVWMTGQAFVIIAALSALKFFG